MRQSLDFSGRQGAFGPVRRTRTVHNAVPGRVRFRVKGLRGSDALKVAIETRLSRVEAVQSASASVVTGSVLVRFDLCIDQQRLSVLLEAVLAETHHPEPVHGDASYRHRYGRPSPATETAAASPRQLQSAREWHTMAAEKVLALLDTNPKCGLSSAGAVERMARYGPNSLHESKTRSKWDIFRGQFTNLPTALLGSAAAISVLTGGFLDALVIAGVGVVNGFIGYWIENQAERTIHSLKSHTKPQARVIRDGKAIDLPAHLIVPGDILVFAAGCRVPADCRILEASHLSVDESALTGESIPVDKDSQIRVRPDSPLAERVNMAFMGTLVTGGESLAVAVATGQATKFGQLQWLLGETTPPKTPIEKQLAHLADQLLLVCCGICGLVFAIGWLRGHGALQMLKVSLSLAAAALPEALPAAATINFALGVQNMRKHHVLVRRLQAIETIGAIQALCLDKTGTLTYNRMSLVEIQAGGTRIPVVDGRCILDGDSPDHPVLRQLLNVCCLCSDVVIKTDGAGAVELEGSSTETVLLRAALNAGVDIVRLRVAFPLIKVENRAENRL